MKTLKFQLLILIMGFYCNLSIAQWNHINSGISVNLSSVCIQENNSTNVWAVGFEQYYQYSSVLLKSTNGGINWNNLSFSFPFYFSLPTSIYMMEDGGNQVGLVSGVGGILATTNGGDNWNVAYVSQDTILFGAFDVGPFGSFWVIGNKVGMSGFGKPVILRSAVSSPGNLNLKKLNIPTSWDYQLTSLCVKDSNNCIITTNTHNPSIILRTTDGGNNWFEDILPFGIAREFWGIIGDDQNDDVIAVGGANGIATIIRSNDFGITWNIVYDNQNAGRLKSIGSPFSYITGTMYAVGENSTILKTTDGGYTWEQQFVDPPCDLNSVSMAHNNFDIAVAVGQNGVIIRTTNGGVTSANETEKIPTEFALYQNYPNPFNPSTVIRYQLPEYSNVTLKVYDILGNEMVTLVNQYKSPGKHEIEWNASEFASGVYYYRLQTDNYSSIKKLILLR